LAAPQDAAAPTLAQALARLVDLPDPAARRSAALELARKDAVTLEQWCQAMASFGEGTFARMQPDVQRHVVPLHVAGKGEAGKVEETELFLYVPASYDPAQRAPLLLMAHGTGGSGRGLHAMWIETAKALG